MSPRVPEDLGSLLIWREIEHGMRYEEKMAWIVDGFPRNERHVVEWMKQVSAVQFVIYLSAPLEVLEERIQGRAATSGRPEDADRELTMERLKRHKRESEPLLRKLDEYGLQTIHVNSDRSLPELQAELRSVVQVSKETWFNIRDADTSYIEHCG